MVSSMHIQTAGQIGDLFVTTTTSSYLFCRHVKTTGVIQDFCVTSFTGQTSTVKSVTGLTGCAAREVSQSPV